MHARGESSVSLVRGVPSNTQSSEDLISGVLYLCVQIFGSELLPHDVLSALALGACDRRGRLRRAGTRAAWPARGLGQGLLRRLLGRSSGSGGGGGVEAEAATALGLDGLQRRKPPLGTGNSSGNDGS